MLGSTLALLAQDTPPPRTITVKVDGTTHTVHTTAATIADALREAQIKVSKLDRLQPAETAKVIDGQTVTIIRITCEVVQEKYTIEAPVITRYDRRMTTKPVVLRQGKPGSGMRTRTTWKKDGVVTQSTTTGAKVLAKPVPTIVVRGNVALPSRGQKVLTMHSTAYDPGPESCGKYATGYTAIGMKATKGVVAVDPRVIPLGTRVYVEGYGYAIAGDTGGAIKGHRIDVCFDTRKEALQWGRRTVKVIILQ